MFEVNGPDGTSEPVEREFDMIHVCRRRRRPTSSGSAPLADAAGWVDVDPHTLRHRASRNVFALGDVGNTPNAKTAAAARKQAPVVAHNVLADPTASGPGALRRLRLLPAHRRARQDRAGRIRLRRQAAPTFPPG